MLQAGRASHLREPPGPASGTRDPERLLSGDAVAEHEFRRAKRRMKRHHREYGPRVILGDNDMNVLHADGCAVQPVGSDCLRTAKLAPSDLLILGDLLGLRVPQFPVHLIPVTMSPVDS